MPSICLESQVAVPLWGGKPCVQVLSANFPEFELNGLLPAQQLSPSQALHPYWLLVTAFPKQAPMPGRYKIGFISTHCPLC